jgi:hypothetical protein
MGMNETEKRWTEIATKQLEGKIVRSVRYMTDEEAEGLDWSCKPLVIEFDDGSFIFPSRDDEGNDGGTIFTSNEENDILPVLWRR